MTRLQSLAAFSLLIMATLSCSSDREQDTVLMASQQVGSAIELPLDSLPGLPVDIDQPLRESSVGLNIVVFGENFFAADFDVANGGIVQLTAPENGVQWAIFRFTGLSEDAVISSITATLDTFNGQHLYSMVSDYGNGRWRISDTEAEPGGQVLQLYSGPAAGLLSGDGSLYVGLLVYAGSSTVINNLILLGNGSLQAPQNLTATYAESSEQVEISWDPVPGATGYRLEFKLASSPENAYAELANLPGDNNTLFMHTAALPLGFPCVYGVEYEYRARSWTNSETSEEASNSAVGLRQLPPVTDFYVSNRAYGDRISIDGFYFAEASAVQLYRDDQLLISQIGNVDSFSFTDIPGDTVPHVYTVFAEIAEGLSFPGPGKTGCQADWDHERIALGEPTDNTYADFAVIGGVPAIVYWQEQTETIHYAYADAAQPTAWTDIGLPGTVKVNARMSLLENNGAPWILFSHGTLSELDPHGVLLVYSSSPEPTVPADFNNGYEIYGGICDGFSVQLRQVNGGLGALYMDLQLNDTENLQYAWSALPVPGQDDWQFTAAGPQIDDSLFEFDLEELDGRPCVMYQTDSDLYFNLANEADPMDAGQWAGHAVLTGAGTGLGGASGVDLVVHDGQPHVACTWGQLENDGGVFYLLPTLPQIPQAQLDWNGGVVTTFNDREPDNISMVFLDGNPWITWSDNIESEAWLVTPINHQIGYLNGFWHQALVPGEAGFDRARREACVLAIDGGIGVFYSSRNNDLVPDKLETIYAWWLPKP
jgi:hypothetical protein